MQVIDALSNTSIPRADGEILLATIMEKPRTWLLAHPEGILSKKQQKKWQRWSLRRKKREPIAYIRGTQEFFGRTFHINNNVLIPRPSTERLVEMILDILKTKKKGEYRRTLDTCISGVSNIWETPSVDWTIVDIGTGSGCIAITMACECPESRIIATDISLPALNIAKKNAKKHRVKSRIRFVHGNLLEPLRNLRNPFILVANPPYIPEKAILTPDVQQYEPPIALRAGPNGCTILNTLLEQARACRACKGFVVECHENHIQSIE